MPKSIKAFERWSYDVNLRILNAYAEGDGLSKYPENDSNLTYKRLFLLNMSPEAAAEIILTKWKAQ